MRRFLFFVIMLLPVFWTCDSVKTENNYSPGFSIFRSYHQIHIFRNDQIMTSYLYDSTLLKPVFFPLYSPSGVPVLRQFPFNLVEGESHDHPHHTGLFFTYGTEGEVNGNNFWANQQGMNKIRTAGVSASETGPDEVVINASADWLGIDGTTVLEEQRTMVFTGTGTENIIDFTIVLKAKGEEVAFKDTKEGMLGIRVADWLSEANGTGTYLNSNRDTTEANIWGERAKWIRLEGMKDGKTIGILIMHHPASLNYPTYWHARGYGLFAANPLGQSVFQQGRGFEHPEPLSYVLALGDSAIFKFRVLVYEGSYSAVDIDAIFENYSL